MCAESMIEMDSVQLLASSWPVWLIKNVWTYIQYCAVYEGEWENDMPNGHGSYTEYATGDIYEGIGNKYIFHL